MIEQLEYGTGTSDYLGQMWTWVSGESAVAATITGKWSDIEHIHANRDRTAIHADRARIEVQG